MDGHLVTPFQGQKHRIKLVASMSQHPLVEVNGKFSVLSEQVSALGLVFTSLCCTAVISD